MSFLRNVSSFKIRYRTNTKDWVDSWDSRNKQRLPIMVQIEILFLIKKKEQTLPKLSFAGDEHQIIISEKYCFVYE